jgi:hypothetical protein
MSSPPTRLADWTSDQVADGERWVRTWAQAGPKLEAIRREELRRLDPVAGIARLCGPSDYTVPPRAPQPTSGLVEQQRWFKKLSRHRD